MSITQHNCIDPSLCECVFASIEFEIVKCSPNVSTVGIMSDWLVCYIDDALFHCLQTLTVFVAVYILQYFAAVITNLWSMGRSPPTACVILTVIFTNLGGVFNFVAYTLLGHHRVSPNLQPGAANGWLFLRYCNFRWGSFPVSITNITSAYLTGFISEHTFSVCNENSF